MTEKFLMARNVYRIFTENNPVMGDSKTFGIPEAKGLTAAIFTEYVGSDHVGMVTTNPKMSNSITNRNLLGPVQNKRFP